MRLRQARDKDAGACVINAALAPPSPAMLDAGADDDAIVSVVVPVLVPVLAVVAIDASPAAGRQSAAAVRGGSRSGPKVEAIACVMVGCEAGKPAPESPLKKCSCAGRRDVHGDGRRTGNNPTNTQQTPT
jgi:hypothetical protein